MSHICIYIFGIILAFTAYEVSGLCRDCGNSCCEDDETCELSIRGGSCFKTNAKVTCDSFFYCYRPTTCCGFMSCCPEGSYCKNSLCYSDSITSSSTTVTWYRYVGIATGVLVILAVVVGVRIKMSRARRAQQATAGTAATGVAVGSPYSTEPNNAQLPPYTVAGANPSAPYNSQPPAYGGQPSAYSSTNTYDTAYSNAGFSEPTKTNNY